MRPAALAEERVPQEAERCRDDEEAGGLARATEWTKDTRNADGGVRVVRPNNGMRPKDPLASAGAVRIKAY